MAADPKDHPVVQPVPEGLPRPPGAVPVGTDEQPGRSPAQQPDPQQELDTSQEWADKRLADVLGEKPSTG